MVVNIFKFLAVAWVLPAVVHAKGNLQHGASPELLVYKSPSCHCCVKWMNHGEEAGFTVYTHTFTDLTRVKSDYGIRPEYRACHTAVTRSGGVVEGHVPAKFVKQFLAEQPPGAIGLSIPAMPVGSPGMEVEERFAPYQVLLLLKDGTSKVYASVNTYEEQFE